jgi:hypothetical protein
MIKITADKAKNNALLSDWAIEQIIEAASHSNKSYVVFKHLSEDQIIALNTNGFLVIKGHTSYLVKW